MRLLRLTSEIKEKEREVQKLHEAERKAYKTYAQSRTKLMSKNYQDLQKNKTKKWYNSWVKSADELQALAVSDCL